MKNKITILIKVSVSATLLYFLISVMDTEKLISTATSVGWGYVLLMLFVLFIIQIFAIYRWWLVLKRDVDVSINMVGSLVFVGLFFNNFLPTIVGGDAVKGYYLYRHIDRGDVTFTSILVDRYAGFTALMFLAFLALIPGYGLIAGTGVEVVCIGIIVLYFMLSLFLWVESIHGWFVRVLSKIGFYGLNEKIDKVYKALMGYKKESALIGKICFLSVFIQAGAIMSFAIIGYGLGIQVSVWYYFLFVPVATVVAMVPLSLSGLGLREGALVFLFSYAGADKEQVIVMSLMWFAGLAFVSIIGGVEYLRLGGKKEFAGVGG